MMMRARVFGLAAVLLASPSLVVAQNSIYGVRGLGFPGRPLSARARSLGGGPAAFDGASAVNPAAVVGFPQVTAFAVSSSEFRGYAIDGLEVNGIRSTRFPLAAVAGRAGRLPLGFALSFGTYVERTFDITNADTILLRGASVAIEDRIVSDGGIADVRGALGWQPHPKLQIGAAAHLLSGSTALRAQRVFSDSAYLTYQQDAKTEFSGAGISAGLVLTVLPGLRVAAAGRFDTHITGKVDSGSSGQVDLPLTLTGGIELSPLPAIRLSATVSRRSWSDAANDLGTGESAFDTWDIGTGLEIGGAATGTSRVPLRVGFRYAQLPFAPGTEQPREIDFSMGTGLIFAGSRAMLDFALERVLRDGAGVRERAWQVSLGMTVRP
jgi:hypothetical protein